MNERNVRPARVDQEEQRHRMTLEALADVDAGRLIDHEAILAWAETLGAGPEDSA